MKRTNRSGWRVSVATVALAAAAVAGGVSLASGADAPVTTAPAASQPSRAALDAFQKARELYRQEKYVEADAQNNRALQLDPALTDAQLLRKVLRAKLADSSATGAGSTVGSDTGASPATSVRLLNPQQISMIRLQELSDQDTHIRGKVPRKTLDAFWNQYVKGVPGADLSTAAYNAFVSPNNFVNQVRSIKQANSPEYSDTVEVTSDPATMVPFRTMIHPFILQNCATAVCHGGDKAGNFRLARPTGGVANDAVIYTNFYIMSRYVTPDGEKMINRDQTSNSLFLQYALPKSVARFPHPGKVEVRRFASENVPEYKAMTAWVRSLAYPRPNYGIVYEIPGQTVAPTSAPAPATKTVPHGAPAKPTR